VLSLCAWPCHLQKHLAHLLGQVPHVLFWLFPVQPLTSILLGTRDAGSDLWVASAGGGQLCRMSQNLACGAG
jgi:hypothetical protein